MKSPLAKFVLKALGFFLVWYIIYDLWLLPAGQLDEFLSLNIIGNSAGILNLFDYNIFLFNRIIGIEGTAGIEVIDGCNGIAAIGLFIGFMVAYPGEWGKKLSYIVLGIATIYIVNILRILVLVITQESNPALFNIMHDYTTTGVFYFVIFGLWMIWANSNELITNND